MVLKNIKYPHVKTIEVKISNFSNGLDTETNENILRFDSAVDCYNFSFKSGALTESLGFEKLTLPSSIEDGSTEKAVYPCKYDNENTGFLKVGLYKYYNHTANERADKLIVINDENKVRFCRVINSVPMLLNLDQTQFEETPELFNYNDGNRDCVLFCSEKDGLNSWDSNVAVKKYTNRPVVTNLCIYKNRTFITEGGERLHIRTEPTNLTSWGTVESSENVYITFDSEQGYINKLLTFNGYMFVIRDFDISRIMWFDNDTYNVSKLLCSGSKMYGKTACICGDVGIILAKDGLYKFDSVSAEKIDLKLNNMFNVSGNQNAVATFRNGIYYLACNLKFDDDEKIGCENNSYLNNALISYEVSSGNYTIERGIDIKDLCTIQYESVDKVLACFNGGYKNNIGQLTSSGKIFGDVQIKYWRSPLTDLGYSNKLKYVREISLISKYDAKLCVFTETESREFVIKGGNVVTQLPVRIKGRLLALSIRSEVERAFISNIKLTVDLLDLDYV